MERRIYPDWVDDRSCPVAQRLALTLGRIADRVDASVAEEKGKIAALAWCRANGNPHLPPPPAIGENDE